MLGESMFSVKRGHVGEVCILQEGEQECVEEVYVCCKKGTWSVCMRRVFLQEKAQTRVFAREKP